MREVDSPKGEDGGREKLKDSEKPIKYR